MSEGRFEPTDLERLRIPDAGRKPRRKRRRWPFVLAGLLVVVVGASIALRPVQVRTATARMGGGGPAEAAGPLLTANGYVEARHQASVAARTTGRLAAVLVEEGDAVEAEQVVARLIDDDQRASVAQASAALALAQAQLAQAEAAAAEAERRSRRRLELQTKGLASDEETEGAVTSAQTAQADRGAAEANVKVAQAALHGAQLELAKTEIRAPFAGVVLRKDAEVGEIVGPIMTSNTARAGAVVTIADMATLEVGVDVNESYIARLAIGTPADIVLDAHPEVHFPAEVRTIFPSADRDRATIPVRVRFVASDARVRPDLGAKVTFLERRPPEEITTVARAIRIPSAAVFDRNGTKIAWVVREGRLVAATLELGAEQGGEVDVRAGLNDGDQVVLGPAKGLRAGQHVRIAAS